MPTSGPSTTVWLRWYELVQEKVGMDLCMIECKMKPTTPILEKVQMSVESPTLPFHSGLLLLYWHLVFFSIFSLLLSLTILKKPIKIPMLLCYKSRIFKTLSEFGQILTRTVSTACQSYYLQIFLLNLIRL